MARRQILRTGVFAFAAVFVAMLLFSLGWAAEPTAKSYNVAAQDLGSALRDFARQSNQEILFSSDVVKGKTSAGVSGVLSTDAALDKLLAGTGLVASRSSSGTILVTLADAKGASAKSDPIQAPSGALNEQSQNRQSNRVGQGPQTGALEEIIVTAQKREQRLIDVPISMVVLSADELQKRQVTTLEDLPSVVPGLAISSNGAGGRYIELRGVSNAIGNSSLIGMYLDEADVTLGATSVQLNPSTYDLERVEVLRGPQGTLYGEGSAGGTIRYITKKPNLNSFALDSDIAALFTQGGAASERINIAANVPLIENQLGLRIAGTFDREGGWINQPAADLRDINGQDVTNVQVKGLWRPNSQLTVNATAILYRNARSIDASDEGSSENWTQAFHLTTSPRVRNDYDLYNLTLAYDFGEMRLLSTSSYLSAATPAWNQGYYFQYGQPGTPNSIYDYYTPIQTVDDRAVTQELRLTSIGSTPLQWTLGGFYRHYDDSVDQPINYFDYPSPPYLAPGPPGSPLPAPYADSQETLFKSWSAFGDVSYKMWDRATIGAGVRYFRDDQTFGQTFDFVGLGTQTAQFHSIDPRIYAQFNVAHDINVYASAAKGFRSGGFNSSATQPAFGPESVWTYELGTKMSVLDGHLALDTALFWSDYTDYQTLGRVAGSPFAYTANVGRARIKGIEWDLTWRPADQWSLSFNGDYLDDKFTALNATGTNYRVGDTLDLVPKYQYVLSGQHDFDWIGKPGYVRLDYSQQGPETFEQLVNGPWYHYESDVIRILSFHASLTCSNNLRFGFFAKNLLNNEGFTNPFYGEGIGVRSRPRTYGIEFSFAL